MIRVRELSLTRTGWLVINRIHVVNGDDEIAVTPRLTPERYTEFDLLLKNEFADLAHGDILFARVYADSNGDRMLDVRTDELMRDIFGRPMHVLLRVR